MCEPAQNEETANTSFAYCSNTTGTSYWLKVDDTSEPFPPLAQLLSVLPPQSAQLVPESYRQLMLSPTSPVFDAYPNDFSLDLNGKRAEWEAVALLPFIDEVRLLGAVRSIDESGVLTEEERNRNINRRDVYYLADGVSKEMAALPS